MFATIIAPIALFAMVVRGNTDCPTARSIYVSMGGPSSDISNTCCTTNAALFNCDWSGRITHIYWTGRGLGGTIPTTISSLSSLRVFSAARNSLRNSIPTQLGSLTNLRQIWLGSNQLTGNLPDSIGYLPNLELFSVQNNPGIWGSVPASYGSQAALKEFFAQNTGLSGSNADLSRLTRAVLLPNANIWSLSQKNFAKNPSGGLTTSQWNTFLSMPLYKRQSGSAENVRSVDLYNQCILNRVQDPSVPAACIAGVWGTYCKDSFWDRTKQQSCHSQYDTIFAGSVFANLYEQCAPWKYGPNSGNCVDAQYNFKNIPLYDSTGQEYLKLQPHNAMDLVTAIFKNANWTPCNSQYRTCRR